MLRFRSFYYPLAGVQGQGLDVLGFRTAKAQDDPLRLLLGLTGYPDGVLAVGAGIPGAVFKDKLIRQREGAYAIQSERAYLPGVQVPTVEVPAVAVLKNELRFCESGRGLSGGVGKVVEGKDAPAS